MDASERLIKASKNGNVKDVKKLLSRGALFTKDEFGNTALHEAAWSGNNDIVKILLKAYCFVDSVNGAGFTPLHLASQNGHAKVAKTLMKWKANPVLKNQHEEAPIHLIAKYDHAHLVPVFAAAKADLDLKAKDDNTALHIAAKLGNIVTVKSLIQNGANPNISNQKSKLPIDYAEFSRSTEAVKLLSPFTQRPRVGVAIGRGQEHSYRLQAELELSKEAKGRRSFFKSKAPKSPKDCPQKPNTNAGTIPNAEGVHMRQRSSTVSGAIHSKRYSREFEDVSSLMYSSSSGSSRGSRSSRSKTRSPSLEELLEEVEKEARGPDYRYVPPPSSDSDNDTGSVSCHPFNRLSNGSLSSNNSSSSLKSPITPHHYSPSPLLKSPQYKDVQEMISPQGFLRPREKKTTPTGNNEKGDDDYVCLRPTSEIHRRNLSDVPSKQTYSVPILSDEVLSHTYEYLPPLPKENEKKELPGFESYVEMAPRSDLKPKMSPLKFSPGKKVSLIDDPKDSFQNTHEPVGMEKTPPQSILTQFEGEKKNSEIDKYLQEELDTIRHAFQIRLTQMDKRYKRHLASVSSIQKTSSNNCPAPIRPHPENDTFSRKQNRRSSWHGKTDETTPPTGPAHPIGEGFDSGSEESLASSVADSSYHDNTTGDSPIPNEQNRLDEVNDSRHDDDQSDDFPGGDDPALSIEMKAIIQQRLQQYKAQMMEAWMREAEEKISAMEKNYASKMGSNKLFHLPASPAKSLDHSETFV